MMLNGGNSLSYTAWTQTVVTMHVCSLYLHCTHILHTYNVQIQSVPTLQGYNLPLHCMETFCTYSACRV